MCPNPRRTSLIWWEHTCRSSVVINQRHRGLNILNYEAENSPSERRNTHAQSYSSWFSHCMCKVLEFELRQEVPFGIIGLHPIINSFLSRFGPIWMQGCESFMIRLLIWFAVHTTIPNGSSIFMYSSSHAKLCMTAYLDFIMCTMNCVLLFLCSCAFSNYLCKQSAPLEKKDHPAYYSAAANKKPLFLFCVYAL